MQSGVTKILIFMKKVLTLLFIFLTLGAYALEREPVWPKGKMPDRQEHQIAAMTNEVDSPKFKAKNYTTAYLEWFDAPAPEVKNGACMILIS